MAAPPVLRVSGNQALDRGVRESVAEVLERPDGVIVAPTDTVYGLFCACDRPVAIERIYDLKGRSSDKPLALIAADFAGFSDAFLPLLSPMQQRRIASVLPGPLTFLVASHPAENMHPALRSQPEGAPAAVVAVRVPDCPPLLDLARALHRPLASTSANRSGQPAPCAIDELEPAIADGVDLILDAGRTPKQAASTILDLSHSPYRVVREGAFPTEQAQALLQEM